MLFPEVRFYTNDSWGIIRGVAAAKGFPIVLMNHYSKGTLYLWTMPENFGDLYIAAAADDHADQGLSVRRLPVRIDAPDHVALFTYDNGAFIVENYRDDAAAVGIARKAGAGRETVTIPPHSFRLFRHTLSVRAGSGRARGRRRGARALSSWRGRATGGEQ